jgi:hypothetical protein
LADVDAFEFVVVQQMIAAVFEPVDSIEFNVAEWTHPRFIRTDPDQLLEVEKGVRRRIFDFTQTRGAGRGQNKCFRGSRGDALIDIAFKQCFTA